MAGIDEEIKTNFKDNKHRMIANIVFTANWIQGRFIEFLKPYGISPQQFNILRILRGAKEDWVAMNTIKGLMVDRAPNATRLSDKLLEKGLVERRRCDTDRRVVFLAITKEGMDLLSDIDKNDAMKEDYLKHITQEEAQRISDIIDGMRS